jgi:hypothetical protein
MKHNPNCDGGHCKSETGEVRVLPYSSDGNLIICKSCYDNEMRFRRDRNRETGRLIYDLPAWETLTIYEGV